MIDDELAEKIMAAANDASAANDEHCTWSMARAAASALREAIPGLGSLIAGTGVGVDATEAPHPSGDSMTEVDGISEALLEFADSIDADGDDLRPLLRRAAEALTDRSAQVRSAVSGAAKFADRAFALERILRRVIEEFNDAARQVGYAVPRAHALNQVEAARNELATYRAMIEAAKGE